MVIISLKISLAFLVNEIWKPNLRVDFLGIIEGTFGRCGRKTEEQDMATDRERHFGGDDRDAQQLSAVKYATCLPIRSLLLLMHEVT